MKGKEREKEGGGEREGGKEGGWSRSRSHVFTWPLSDSLAY
jgi:hypothetical protein